MNLKVELHISPDEVRKKTCSNCQFSKLQQYHEPKTDQVYVSTLCTIVDKLTTDDAPGCGAYEPVHWETIRSNDYKRLI